MFILVRIIMVVISFMINRISPKSVLLLRARYTAIAVVVFFLEGALYAFVPNIARLLVIVSAILYVIVFTAYAALQYKNYSYYINNGDIQINKGVIFRLESNLSTKKIQYVEILATPFQRIMKLCTVILHTAGYKVTIQQVDLEIGEKIKSYVNKGEQNEI